MMMIELIHVMHMVKEMHMIMMFDVIIDLRKVPKFNGRERLKEKLGR